MNTPSSTEIIQELGQRFAQYRKRAKLTQKDVAEQSGVSVFSISGFENGSQCGISLKTFIKLLRAVGEKEAIQNILPEQLPSPAELFHTLYGKKK